MVKTIVEKHFDKVAQNYDYYKEKNSFYYENLKKLLGKLIPKNKNVFEFGCGTGDLLASLNPKMGYGADISSEMIKLAKLKHRDRNLHFSVNWPSTINHKQSLAKSEFGKSLDFVFMSDVIEHLDNPQKTFVEISKLMDKKTVFICTMANPIWEPFLMIAEKLRLKMPEGPHIRITNYKLKILIEKTKMKIIKHDYRLLMPIKIPVITDFANKYLEKYFKKLAFIEYFVIRKITNS